MYQQKYPVKVEIEFNDGTVEYLDGGDARVWQDQIQSASMMACIHGSCFQPLNWKKKTGLFKKVMLFLWGANDNSKGYNPPPVDHVELPEPSSPPPTYWVTTDADDLTESYTHTNVRPNGPHPIKEGTKDKGGQNQQFKISNRPSPPKPIPPPNRLIKEGAQPKKNK